MKKTDKTQHKQQSWLRLIDLAEAWAEDPDCELSSDEILTELWAGFWRGDFDQEDLAGFYFRQYGEIYAYRRIKLLNILLHYLRLKLNDENDHMEVCKKLSGWSFETLKRILNKNDEVAFSAYIEPMGIDKTDLLAWCERRGFKPPFFWMEEATQTESVPLSSLEKTPEPPKDDEPAKPPNETAREREQRLLVWAEEEFLLQGKIGTIQRVANREGVRRQMITRILQRFPEGRKFLDTLNRA